MYEVSSLGDVRSLNRVRRGREYPGILRVQITDKNGYRTVGLYNNGHAVIRKVHQLVLEAFVGPRPDGYVCRHLNGVRHDNRLLNLAWGTPLENSADRATHGTLRYTTYCPKRHLKAGANAKVSGARASLECRTCVNDRKRRAVP